MGNSGVEPAWAGAGASEKGFYLSNDDLKMKNMKKRKEKKQITPPPFRTWSATGAPINIDVGFILNSQQILNVASSS